MISSSLKRFLVGAAVVASSLPSLAMAAPTCVYLIGQIDGKTITTPAQLLKVPSSSALAEPIILHVDETAQNITGYTLTLPGFDGGTYGSPVFVPGFSQELPAFTFTVPALPLNTSRCVNYDGVEVPAVPFRIPASAFTVPGVVANIGGAIFNITGNPFTVPSTIITYDGKQVLVPEFSGKTPGGQVGTPEKSITLNVNGSLHSLQYLPPQG